MAARRALAGLRHANFIISHELELTRHSSQSPWADGRLEASWADPPPRRVKTEQQGQRQDHDSTTEAPMMLTPGRRPPRRRMGWFLLGAIILVATGGGCWLIDRAVDRAVRQ